MALQPAAPSDTVALPASGEPFLGNITSNSSRVHLVKVGAGGFHFQPAQLNNVSVNDIVTFEFYPPDHSVARAEYESACVPYEYTGKGKVGFWSETQLVDTVDDVCVL